ncbi:hypothetical protein OSTOST_06861 [Ostertagia ostertagi]
MRRWAKSVAPTFRLASFRPSVILESAVITHTTCWLHWLRSSHGRLACEYRAAPPPSGSNGVMACEYRANPVSVPLSAILAVAIGVPVVLVLCLFGAVWLQEAGNFVKIATELCTKFP